jgi:hypothetical protein
VIERLLLDVHGDCRVFPAGPQATVPSALPEALGTLAGASARVLTDWGPGAVLGVATVSGTAAAAPALLEKRLRDQGETDDISHLLVHQSQTRGGSTELVYSAIPVQTWLRYQQQAADHPRLLLLHDWTRTLLDWARGHELATGALLVMHPQGLDVVVLTGGRIQTLERLRIFRGEPDAWHRVGLRVASMLRQRQEGEGAIPAAAIPLVMWVLRGTESELAALLGGLGTLRLTECWAEAPVETQVVLGRTDDTQSLPVQPLDLAAIATAMPLRQAVGRRLDRAAALAEQWLPALALASLALAVIIGGTAAFMHNRNAQALATLPGQTQAQAVWRSLDEAVQRADKLAEQQKDSRRWLQQRLASSKLPDMAMVLAHVRRSLPAGLVIDEVGLVVENDNHLLTVIGHAAAGVGDSLHSESAFAQALQSDGFTLVKRDLLLRDGQPGFKLSMTWSAS